MKICIPLDRSRISRLSHRMEKDSETTDLNPLSRGVAQAGVRITNERTVLTLLALNPGASNADVARLSGLGPQTTSRIVGELESRGLVIRGDVLRGRRGQPATPLFINPEGALAIGVEIGWRHVEVLVLELSGKTLTSVRRNYAWPDARTILDEVAAEVASILSGLTDLQRSRLAGIGVASPSHIHRNIDLVDAPDDQAALWRDIDLADRLAKVTGLSVEWFNDGTAACWAEFIAHPAPRPVDFAYFQIGAFVGAGLLAKGELWEGNGHAANLGSMVVCDGHGNPTFVHLVASIMALQRALTSAGIAVPDGSPSDWDWDALEPVASKWLDDAGRALANAIINTRAVIELEKAIVDGAMPRAIVTRLHESVQHHLAALPLLTDDHPSVEIGHLGAEAAPVGAAQLVLFKRHFSRAWKLFST